jgi:hypothetical protein
VKPEIEKLLVALACKLVSEGARFKESTEDDLHGLFSEHFSIYSDVELVLSEHQMQVEGSYTFDDDDETQWYDAYAEASKDEG